MSPIVFLTVVFIVVGLPVTLGIGADVYKRRLAFKERELDLLARQTAECAAQSAAQNERLEQRLRVLERIVTDRSLDHSAILASRIEDLRDPLVDQLKVS